MFGESSVTSGLSLTKVLTGLNKTLSIANQVIPIYQQAKPMIQNARGALKILKEFGSNNPTSKTTSKPITTKTIKRTKGETKKVSTSSPFAAQNTPVFFV